MNNLIKIYKTSPYLEYKNKTEFNESIVGSNTYGEITQKGTNDLVKHFKSYFNSDTVFYDLGSGLGKMVLHIGIQYEIKKSIGIEYSEERHQGAIDLQKQYASKYNNIQFYKGNFLTHNLSDATVVYVDNTCLESKLMKKLYSKFPKNCLILYKKQFSFLSKEVQNVEQNLIERTYNQKILRWVIKK